MSKDNNYPHTPSREIREGIERGGVNSRPTSLRPTTPPGNTVPKTSRDLFRQNQVSNGSGSKNG